ncbi:MAG TPA: metal-sulfur cluster assembly factor [Anaerolineae bacterium]|nr:metal-sulfur cluster assembly factor [Anaerolineae bacterium]
MDERVLEALREVVDPELGVNVVDLGLVYNAEVEDGQVQVAMTLTTPGCPLAGQIRDMAEAAIWRTVPDVESVDIGIVWSPPWRPSMMTDDARDELGWMDY